MLPAMSTSPPDAANAAAEANVVASPVPAVVVLVVPPLLDVLVARDVLGVPVVPVVFGFSGVCGGV